MVRPSDLPQPVRPHRPHEDLRERHLCSPGPARYSGRGVTEFDRDSALGTIPKATRFASSQLVPGDSFSSADRDAYLETPGPKYAPQFNDSRLPVSFSRTTHETVARPSGTPGPGAYATPLPWDRGVTISNSARHVRGMQSTPGPGAYTPTKAPLRDRSACIGAHAKTDASIEKHLDCPPLAALDAMDSALDVTRDKAPCVGFGKAPRVMATGAHTDNPNGPGAYDVARAATCVQRHVKGGGFSRSTRIPVRKPDTDGRLVALPSPDVSSTRHTTPAISFARGTGLRGVPTHIEELGAIPTAKYTPKYDVVQRSVKGVVKWPSANGGGGDRIRALVSPTANADFIEAKSTLGGPTLAFPEAARPNPYPSGSRTTPGPGHYNPRVSSRKEPRSAGFTKERRLFNSGHVGEDTPGCIYHPDVSASRPPVGAGFTLARGPRATRFAIDTCGPDAIYAPQFSAVDRNKRSAIVYLTG